MTRITEYRLAVNCQGWYVAAKVPMNNLPGCEMFFWQQASPYYQRKGNALRKLNQLKGDSV